MPWIVRKNFFNGVRVVREGTILEEVEERFADFVDEPPVKVAEGIAEAEREQRRKHKPKLVLKAKYKRKGRTKRFAPGFSKVLGRPNYLDAAESPLSLQFPTKFLLDFMTQES